MLRLLIAGLVLGCSQPALATTFIAGGVAAGTNTIFGNLTDPQSGSAGAAGPGAISASSSSLVSDDLGAYVQADASVRANWNSPESGNFSINWSWYLTTYPGYAQVQTNQVPSNWFYTFTASDNGFFNVSGNVTGSGDTFGLQPVFFGGDGGGFIGGADGDNNPNVFDPTGMGALTFALISGTTYTFTASNNGNIFSEFGLNAIGDAQSRFDWNIKYNVSAVPLPATLPFLAVSLVALGALGARKRASRRFAG